MKPSFLTADNRFSTDLGLWRLDGPGHTSEVAAMECVHPGPDAASILVWLAEHQSLAPEEFHVVLDGLARLQVRPGEGEHVGCFRWYAEESEPRDTNAAFFVGLNLLVLHAGYSQCLSAASRGILREIFVGLDAWFDRTVKHRLYYYPNKYLGDLVCSWLLKEALDRPAPEPLKEAMHGAARYWLDNGWGWGEHLSDLYSHILLDELGALLLLAKRFPKELTSLYRELLRNLLALEDFFDAGPRVPAIRSYAFQGLRMEPGFREQMRPCEAEAEPVTKLPPLPFTPRFPFGPVFHRKGWSALAGDKELLPASRDRSIACFGSAVAQVRVEPTFRIGSLSKYPIMPSADRATAGLSWQSMPVAFAAGSDTWGFLRWAAREGGIDRFHPARDKHHAYLHNALSDVTSPPLIGQTRCLQVGRRVVALRYMPVLSHAWECLGDGWDVNGANVRILEEVTLPNGGSKLVLQAKGADPMAFWHLPILPTPALKTAAPVVSQEGELLTWRVQVAGDSLRHHVGFAHLWFVGLPHDPDPKTEVVENGAVSPHSVSILTHWIPFGSATSVTGAPTDLLLMS